MLKSYFYVSTTTWLKQTLKCHFLIHNLEKTAINIRLEKFQVALVKNYLEYILLLNVPLTIMLKFLAVRLLRHNSYELKSIKCNDQGFHIFPIWIPISMEKVKQLSKAEGSTIVS